MAFLGTLYFRLQCTVLCLVNVLKCLIILHVQTTIQLLNKRLPIFVSSLWLRFILFRFDFRTSGSGSDIHRGRGQEIDSIQHFSMSVCDNIYCDISDDLGSKDEESKSWSHFWRNIFQKNKKGLETTIIV